MPGGCTASRHAPVSDAMIVTPFADAKFTPVNPALPDGPEIAVLRGDPATGKLAEAPGS